MATTAKSLKDAPHIAVFPSAGMGHLMPLLRLSTMLAARGCMVTIISAQPTVSAAETDQLSTFFTIHPQIKRVDYQLLPLKKSKFINEDPFFIQFEAIDNSVHLVHPVVSSLSPPVSGVVADFPILRSVSQIAEDLSVPTYTLVVTCARFFCLMTNLPLLAPQQANATEGNGYIELPVVGQIPVTSIPAPMFDPDHYFAACIALNSPSLQKIKGIIIGTCTCFEPEAIEALNSSGLAPILPVGPLQPFVTGEASDIPWLDEQVQGSVVFVSLGNRDTLSKDQIRELGAGLEKSGCNFLWVLKANKVDKDDTDGIEEILGEAFLERTKGKGMVVKRWVNQDEILAHPSIGGFLSHAGWNSVTEAARLGVPILAWTPHGDQRVNAEVVERMGLGLWDRSWGWYGETLVTKDQIAEKVKELMLDTTLRTRAREIKESVRQLSDAKSKCIKKIHQGFLYTFSLATLLFYSLYQRRNSPLLFTHIKETHQKFYTFSLRHVTKYII